jgi:hypothetical protein
MSDDTKTPPEEAPGQEQLKCVALSERDASKYIPVEGHDTVVCLSFGVFTMDDFKDMGYAGCSPVFMVGSGMEQKPMLEPFFIMGDSDDVKLMIDGFFSDVFKAYSSNKGKSELDEGQGREHDDGTSE